MDSAMARLCPVSDYHYDARVFAESCIRRGKSETAARFLTHKAITIVYYPRPVAN